MNSVRTEEPGHSPATFDVHAHTGRPAHRPRTTASCRTCQTSPTAWFRHNFPSRRSCHLKNNRARPPLTICTAISPPHLPKPFPPRFRASQASPRTRPPSLSTRRPTSRRIGWISPFLAIQNTVSLLPNTRVNSPCWCLRTSLMRGAPFRGARHRERP